MERIARYIEKTDSESRTLDIMWDEVIALAAYGKKYLADAINLAYRYGQAKGWRARQKSGKKPKK